ncbi:MAG: AsnC family transcriptional regulator, partial [Sphingopyxis sp.]
MIMIALRIGMSSTIDRCRRKLSALLAEMHREVLAYPLRIRDILARFLREMDRWRTMIDRIDVKLLDLLQRQGPRPAAELGEVVGLSASA